MTTSLSFTGLPGSYIIIPYNAQLDIGSSVDFTVEWYQYQTDTNSWPRIFMGSVGVTIEGGVFYLWLNGSPTSILTITGYKNTWVHFAICRSSNTIRVFRNGTQIGNNLSNSAALINNGVSIGNGGAFDISGAYGGYLYGFNYLIGFAKYTTTFTVPSTFVVTSNTVILATGSAIQGSLGSTAINTNVTTVASVPTTVTVRTNFANTATGSIVYDASAVNGPTLNVSDVKDGSGALILVSSSNQFVQLPPFTSSTTGITITSWFKHDIRQIFNTTDYSTSGTGTVSALTSISGSTDTYLAFTAGTVNLTLNSNTVCDIFMIGGGGGGGRNHAGGGGAGAYYWGTNLILNSGTYAITVGAGGLGQTDFADNGTNGGNTSISLGGSNVYLVNGGGRGGGSNSTGSADITSRTGKNGGCGGGGGSHNGGITPQNLSIPGGSASNSSTNGTGNNGGTGCANQSGGVLSGGGGGGIGGAGQNALNSQTGSGGLGPAGGAGLLVNITGTNAVYGGGGGGGVWGDAYAIVGGAGGGVGAVIVGGKGGGKAGTNSAVGNEGENAVANTGSGGGGGGPYAARGGNGSAGIVIIRFKSIISGTRLFEFGNMNYSLLFNTITNPYATAGANYQYTQGTVEAWIKNVGTVSNYQHIIGVTARYSIFLFNNKLVAYDWVAATNRDSNITISDGAWHHVAFTFNSGISNGSKLYYDGIPVLTFTYTTSTGTNFHISNGSTGSSGFQPFSGYIDEARVWSTVRTDEQILANYNIQIPSNSSGLTGYWLMNEGTGTTVVNQVSGGPSLTLFNSPTWSRNDNDVIAYMPINGPLLSIGPTSVIPNSDVPLLQDSTPNVWHFFGWSIPYAAGTNTTTHTFYFDGQSTTRSYRYPQAVNRLMNYLGRSIDPTIPYYNGLIDNFRWYDRALTSEEINVIYNSQLFVRYPPITNIVPPWNYYALKLGGTNAIQLKDYIHFNGLTTSLTLECWIYPTTYTNTGIIAKSGNYGLFMSNTGLMRTYNWVSSTFVSLTTTVPLNTWSHVAFVINNGVANGSTFYYNGNAVTTITYNIGALGASNPVFIGTELSNSATRFVGYMSNVRIWNYARTSADISGNYNKVISSATGLIASLYLNDLPTSLRAANNAYPVPRTINRAIMGMYTAPDISTNVISPTRCEESRTIVFTDDSTIVRGVEDTTILSNISDTKRTYYLNGYLLTQNTFNVGTGRNAGQTHLYAYRNASYDTTFYFFQYYPPLSYTNFASTAGLVLISSATQSGTDISLTPATMNRVGNVWTDWSGNYATDFKITFRMDISGGTSPPADGFCIQWHTANDVSGGIGGACGWVSAAKYAILFTTYTSNRIILVENGVTVATFNAVSSFYADLYYWIDYSYKKKEINVYVRNTDTKPQSPTYTFSSVNFPVSTMYYIGFGAATGGATSNHFLRSFTHEIISYKLVWIPPIFAPSNVSVVLSNAPSSDRVLTRVVSENSYNLRGVMDVSFNYFYLNMNYSNGNYLTFNNNGLFYFSHRSADSVMFAISTRVYVHGYAGPVFQLRRSSDNALQDFYTDEMQTFLTTGPNNTGTSFATWIGVSTAYICVMYNQNGTANHATNVNNNTTQPVLALVDGKYVIQWIPANSTFLKITEPITPNTIFTQFYNTNTTGSIACYSSVDGTLIVYQQRFSNLSVNGGNSTADWFFRAGGTKLSYVDGTPTTSMTAWGSWKTVALSTSSPTHNNGGFAFIGRDSASNFSTNSINGYMTEIIFHRYPMSVGAMYIYHADRLLT